MSGVVKALPLRLSWRARRSDTANDKWWPNDVDSGVTIDRLVWFSDGVSVVRRSGCVHASWSDTSWQSSPKPSCVRVTVTLDALTISVPPIWRAHIYLAWREGRLLVSSDLRTLAHSLSETQPSLVGVANFLVHGHSGSGLVPSLYRNIWTLQPGYCVTIRDEYQMYCKREWKPEDDDRYNAETFVRATTEVCRHLDEIADSILKSHSRVACLFSGGLDSSLVAAMLLRRAPERVVLFNLGSGFGTITEAHLRARFLGEFGAVSHAVKLPDHASLIRSLRATNAMAPLPVGSIFSHVFEEIIAVAQHQGCDAIATGDGGDEVFIERENVLVDLIARGRRLLIPAAAHFALSNDERITHPLWRAYRIRHALRRGRPIPAGMVPEHILFGASLAAEVTEAVARGDDDMLHLWQEGWTLSGLASWRQAASVPEWEPVNAAAPGFSVLSPLVDECVVAAVLRVRREDFLPLGFGNCTKRLLRHSALTWLPPDIAMHPKIGSADGELLDRMRSEEHDSLLDLLGSETARRVGFYLPSSAEDPAAPLWRSDRWVRVAALVAWFDQHSPTLPERKEPTNITLIRVSEPVEAPPRPSDVRRSRVHVVMVAALNIAAQLAPHRVVKQECAKLTRLRACDGEALRAVLIDLARRACKLPLVTGSSFAMHRALSWYLRLLGLPAALVQGARKGQTERRYWVEVGGANIDVNGSQVPLERCAEPRRECFEAIN